MKHAEDPADRPASAPAAGAIDVEVVYSPAPRQTACLPVRLPPHACTVRDALRASGLWQQLPEAPAAAFMRQQTSPVEAPATDGAMQPASHSAPSSATSAAPPGAGGDWRGLRLAVFGVRATLETCLEPGDRLDVCRPLRVDPKLARRERFNQQGARTSGLFARRRPGGVAGY